MSYQPAIHQRPAEVSITPLSYQSLGPQLYTMGAATSAAAAWPAANVVLYIPFWVPEPTTITKMFWAVGVAAGNADAGVYDETGARLVSTGTTAVAGASIAQIVDVTDTTLARGRYYMALVVDTTTTLTLLRVAPAAGIAQSIGCLEQAAVTLPLATNASPATFAKYTRAFIPVFGLQVQRTIGP